VTKPFFTISIDFELFWGVHDTMKLSRYGDSILQGRESIPKMLSIFKEYSIKATWATVGMLSFQCKKELLQYLPTVKPNINNKKLDPYHHLQYIGNNEKEDPYHFGYSIVKKILEVEGMEIASHTFSHYNYLEFGSSRAFKSDLESSNEAFKRLNVCTPSIVFCKNQYDETSLNIARECGFSCYRGNENSLLFKPRPKQYTQYRLLRLVDAYFNITEDYLSNVKKEKSGLINIPSSRFLRPYNGSNYLETKKLQRIKNSMEHAAKTNQGFHLWWHPHNFGRNLLRNISSLKIILNHYRFLSQKYGMISLNMKEASKTI